MTIFRAPIDYAAGQLSQPAAISASSLRSSGFTSLGTNYSTSIVLPIILHDPAAGIHECVWVTGHTTGSDQVTVVRGKEGTTQQAWDNLTDWIVAPTASRDALLSTTKAARQALVDQHAGMRVAETDTGNLPIWTNTAGWQPQVGSCFPTDAGKSQANTDVPDGATMLERVGSVINATPSGGLVAVTFKTPFPNSIHGALAGSIAPGSFPGIAVCTTMTASSMNVLVQLPNGSAPTICSFYYIAKGW
jgi:hypothetical protein